MHSSDESNKTVISIEILSNQYSMRVMQNILCNWFTLSQENGGKESMVVTYSDMTDICFEDEKGPETDVASDGSMSKTIMQSALDESHILGDALRCTYSTEQTTLHYLVQYLVQYLVHYLVQYLVQYLVLYLVHYLVQYLVQYLVLLFTDHHLFMVGQQSGAKTGQPHPASQTSDLNLIFIQIHFEFLWDFA